MDRLWRRIKDKRLLALVKAFLKAGVMTTSGDREQTLTRTPQGSGATSTPPKLGCASGSYGPAPAWTATGRPDRRSGPASKRIAGGGDGDRQPRRGVRRVRDRRRTSPRRGHHVIDHRRLHTTLRVDVCCGRRTAPGVGEAAGRPTRPGRGPRTSSLALTTRSEFDRREDRHADQGSSWCGQRSATRDRKRGLPHAPGAEP